MRSEGLANDHVLDNCTYPICMYVYGYVRVHSSLSRRRSSLGTFVSSSLVH